MRKKSSKEISTLKNTEQEEIFLYPVIAITPEKVPLGTISMPLWKRPEQSVRAKHQNKPIEEKDSDCWIEGYGIGVQTKTRLLPLAQNPQGAITSRWIETGVVLDKSRFSSKNLGSVIHLMLCSNDYALT